MKTAQRQKKATRYNVVKFKHNDPASIYLSTLAPTGRRSAKCQLSKCLALLAYKGKFDQFGWHTLTYQDITRIRFLLIAQAYSINTINLTLSVLRGVVQSSFNMGLINADQLLRVQSIKRVTGYSLPAGRSLGRKDLNRVLKTCSQDRSLGGYRDTALLALMAVTGIRRAEVTHLKVADFNSRNGELRIAVGKGRKARITHIPVSARSYLKAWLKKKPKNISALFCPIQKNDLCKAKSLTSQSIYLIVKQRTEEVGIEGVTPHSLRRTYITLLLEQGVDLNTVRGLIGHSNIMTTARYDRRGVDCKRYNKLIFN